MIGKSRITLIKTLDVTDLAGEKVMIDFTSGKYFLLKGSANDIWDYIQKPITVEEIHKKLLEEYDVDTNICYESILTFLNQMENYGFIQVENM